MIRRPPRSTLFPTRRSSDLPGRDPSPSRCATAAVLAPAASLSQAGRDRKSTRLNSSHTVISYAVFCLKKKKNDKKNSIREIKRAPTSSDQCRDSYDDE